MSHSPLEGREGGREGGGRREGGGERGEERGGRREGGGKRFSISDSTLQEYPTLKKKSK